MCAAADLEDNDEDGEDDLEEALEEFAAEDSGDQVSNGVCSAASCFMLWISHVSVRASHVHGYLDYFRRTTKRSSWWPPFSKCRRCPAAGTARTANLRAPSVSAASARRRRKTSSLCTTETGRV
jgi:hypothetical protein